MIGVRFCPWYPLAAAGEHAPDAAGVFQVRVRSGLVSYPRGKSAMVHYGAGACVRRAIEQFAAVHPSADWLCRHTELMPAGADPGELARSLIERFRARFGAPPDPARSPV